jgi:formiminotetrahydrofolate cyclodeaminase
VRNPTVLIKTISVNVNINLKLVKKLTLKYRQTLKEALVGMKKNLTEIKKGVKQKIGMGREGGRIRRRTRFA